MKGSRFSLELTRIMAEKGVSQNELASSTSVSSAHVSYLANGKRLPSAEWLDVVSSSLALTADEKVVLHRSAAHDLVERTGYKLDLTKE